MRVAALLLAGGRGTRMGGDTPKPALLLSGRSLADRALDAVRTHCAPLVIGTSDPEAFAALALPAVADRRAGHLGPLAGLEAAGHWLAAHAPDVTHLVSVPGDTPFLPADLVPRLVDEAGATPRIAVSPTGSHPTVGLWPRAALVALTPYLDEPDADLSVRAFLRRCGCDEVPFGADPAAPGGDPFFNVNTPADFATAESMLVFRAL